MTDRRPIRIRRAGLGTLAALALVASSVGCETAGTTGRGPSRPSVTRRQAIMAPAAEPHVADVTFTRDVAPLLQRHCQECHRPGNVAPFSLLTYREAYTRRAKIQKAVVARKMPPWKPVPGFGDFRGVRRLSDTEIAIIDRWVRTGGREGDPADMPPPRVFDDRPALETADLVLPAPSFTIPARTGDLYRCLTVDAVFPEDRHVTAMEFVPSNRKVVHHAIVYVDTTGRSVDLDRLDAGPGYTCFGGTGFRAAGAVGAWIAGGGPWFLPEGAGILVPAGARLVFQMHYHNSGPDAETDASTLRLRFARAPVRERVYFARVIDRRLSIPAGAKRHELDVTMPVTRPMKILAIGPHMHLLGREIEVWATQPDGTVVPLIYIDDWDFAWQGLYFFRTPVRLARGGRIDLKAIWDNSADNPRNPSRPPRRVTWGERTTDEMGHAALLYTLEDDDAGFAPR